MKKIFLISLTLIALFWSACSPDKQETIASLTDEQLEAIKFFGFDSATSKISADGKCIVEGDIVLDMEKVMNYFHENKAIDSNSAEERQRVVGQLSTIPYTITPTLTFCISTAFTPTESATIRAGVVKWSSVTTNIIFTEIPPETQANISFVLDNTIPEFAYMEPFPTGGAPFSTIKINRTRINLGCPECFLNIITHETGHALGFHHTNVLTAGGYLLGSPIDDATSIMNSRDYGPLGDFAALPGPSNDDFRMASGLYPSNNLVLTLIGASITYWSHDNDFCFVHIPYNQPAGNGRSCNAIVEILKNGLVVKTIDWVNLVGVASSGTMHTPQIYLPPGFYQVRARGKNYKQDFTQPGFSNIVSFYKAF